MGALSPRINEAFESALDYDEMANYLSLTFLEGKIDFIAASSITGYSSSKQLFFGQEVFLDHPVEIVAKKIYFRGDRVLPRDLFDLLVEITEKAVMQNAHIAQNQEEYQQQYNGLVEKNEASKVRFDEVTEAISTKESRSERLDTFIKRIKAQTEPVADFDTSFGEYGGVCNGGPG